MRAEQISDAEFEYIISDFSEFRTIILRFPSSEWVGGWLFRGQANDSWALNPKAGRQPYNDNDFYFHRFSQWCREASAYKEYFPENLGQDQDLGAIS